MSGYQHTNQPFIYSFALTGTTHFCPSNWDIFWNIRLSAIFSLWFIIFVHSFTCRDIMLLSEVLRQGPVGVDSAVRYLMCMFILGAFDLQQPIRWLSIRVVHFAVRTCHNPECIWTNNKTTWVQVYTILQCSLCRHILLPHAAHELCLPSLPA